MADSLSTTSAYMSCAVVRWLGLRDKHMDLTLTAPIDDYLKPSMLIDVDHPAVRAEARALKQATALTNDGGANNIAFIKTAYEFVRDDVAHSWDLQSTRVTAKASDVLDHREGICFAKSHLLAALLRGEGVPAGLCYQRLVLFSDPKDDYSLHAMNTVYVESIGRWIRVDARGNKPGVDALISLVDEHQAILIRTEISEIDYPYNFT